ncbi:MAG: CHASE3 domain-containing protein, partial [Bdellovibrionales bacterium]|nr:CHASE3 domain-containing protein [Oligoflexia bacterium]
MFEFDRRRGSSLFFILAIPTLLFSQYLSLRFNQKVKEDFAWVTHTFEVVHELQSMETSVLDVQSGQRGYIITLMPVHKDLMHHGIQQTLVHWDKAKELTSDNPVQQANLEQFKETLSARLVHAEKVIKARETQGFSASQSLIVEGGGTRLTNQLLSILEQMKVVESKLLAKREVAAHNSANASSLTVIFGGLFSTLLIGFAALLIRRDLKTRAFATRALTISEQKFRDTFNLSPIGVALTSTDGVWEEVNLTLCRMLGYAAEELIGHHFNEVTHPEDLEIGKRHTRSLNDHQANTVSYEKRYLS